MATFQGFPAEGLAFLSELAQNNNREWFQDNKKRYEKLLKKPAVEFVEAMGQRLQSISPQINVDARTNGSGNLMRINRDTRFSEDKSPYKTAIAGMFWEGAGKKTENPAFGFHMESDGMRLMSGMFQFPKDVLTAYREAVDDQKLGSALTNAIAEVKSNGSYVINGEHYKKAPRGYAEDHPRIEWLRYNALYASYEMVPAHILTSPEAVEVVFKHFADMAPIQRWLVQIQN